MGVLEFAEDECSIEAVVGIDETVETKLERDVFRSGNVEDTKI